MEQEREQSRGGGRPPEPAAWPPACVPVRPQCRGTSGWAGAGAHLTTVLLKVVLTIPTIFLTAFGQQILRKRKKKREKEESLDSSTGCYAAQADHCCRRRHTRPTALTRGERSESQQDTQENGQPHPGQTLSGWGWGDSGSGAAGRGEGAQQAYRPLWKAKSLVPE